VEDQHLSNTMLLWATQLYFPMASRSVKRLARCMSVTDIQTDRQKNRPTTLRHYDETD